MVTRSPKPTAFKVEGETDVEALFEIEDICSAEGATRTAEPSREPRHSIARNRREGGV